MTTAQDLSIIVTTYNVGKYIATCLHSIIQSNLDGAEIILVDDGSTDDTRARIDQFERNFGSKFSIIRRNLHRNTIGGVAIAANIGMDVATRNHIIFIDGDDFLFGLALKEALQKHRAEDADVTFCDCVDYWDHNGKIAQYEDKMSWPKLRSNEGNAERLKHILTYFAPMPWRKIYSRKFLDEKGIRFPVGDYFFEDTVFHWYAIVQASRLSIYDGVTHAHRMARAGQTLDAKGPKFLQIFEHYDSIRRFLEDSGEINRYSRDLAAWLISHIHWSAERTSPSFQVELFNKAYTRLRKHSWDELFGVNAHLNHDKNRVGRFIALTKNDLSEYFRYI